MTRKPSQILRSSLDNETVEPWPRRLRDHESVRQLSDSYVPFGHNDVCQVMFGFKAQKVLRSGKQCDCERDYANWRRLQATSA